MAETMQLSHVNTPPAQTWNYLRVNDIALEVPVPAAWADAPDAPETPMPEAANPLLAEMVKKISEPVVFRCESVKFGDRFVVFFLRIFDFFRDLAD